MFNKLPVLILALFSLVTATFSFPGGLDPFFGTGGVSTAPIGKGGFDLSFAAALQTDGKIVIVGDSRSNSETFSVEPVNSIVSRINADGTLDTSFGYRGIARRRMPGRANAVVMQADGKIVVGGYTLAEVSFFQVFFVARYNPDGTPDGSFGTGGILTTSFADINQRGILNSLAVQPDGKIVAAGYSFFGSSTPQSMAVVRYNSNGTPDSSFDGDGRAFIDLAAAGSRANVVALQADGKIVVGGLLREPVGTVSDFALVRLNTDGSPDNTFDGDGKLTTEFSTTSTNILGLGIQSDGRIVAAGNSNQGAARDIAMARYNTDGSLDTSFDGDGKLTTDIGDDLVGNMRIQADGKIVVCGQSFAAPNPHPAFMSARYNTDGSLDNSYNGNGKVLTPLPDRVGKANAAFIRPDGKIILAGHASGAAVSDFAVLHYEANGILDTTFNGDGIAIVEPGNSADWIYDMAVQPDGKILAAGYSYSGLQNVTVARFLPGGALDTTFGDQGSVTYSVQDVDTYANDVIVQPDGKILVSVGNYFESRFITLRYNSNGTPDNSFGTNGVATISVGAQADYPVAMVLQPDGKIVVAGSSSDSPSVGFPTLMRMNSNGTIDGSFGSGGSIRLLFTQHLNNITSMALQSDGKIVIGGDDNTPGKQGLFVCRLNSNGIFDDSFGDAGAAYASFGASSHFSSLAVQKDGKIVIAGRDGGLDAALARFNTNGTPDNSFDGDGKTVIPAQNNAHFLISDIALQANGKVVASAIALIPPSEGLVDDGSAVLRINTNGSLDTSFGTGGVALNLIGDGGNGFYTTLVLPTGRILAGGYSSNGANDDFTLARFQAEQAARFDYDGDGRSDISVFRPSEGNWYIQNSSTMGVSNPHFGQNGDLTTPGDFDGDGKADISVYRPSEGNWYRLNSSDGSFFGTHFGVAEDKPAVGDFDGDGRADISVFRPSEGNWYRLNSIDGSFFGTHFGVAEDKPAVGDFDGDGKADISVFRPSEGNWYRLNSADGSFFGTHFGTAEDKPTVGDFDGDGKTDISVFRPSEGNWYRLNSADGSFFGLHFGLAEDKPVAADYDGDGKADIGVFRPSEGNWYILNSTAGFLAQHFGAAEDKPTPNSFVY
jgi:uncharacterized delta-60 repeat protein